MKWKKRRWMNHLCWLKMDAKPLIRSENVAWFCLCLERYESKRNREFQIHFFFLCLHWNCLLLSFISSYWQYCMYMLISFSFSNGWTSFYTLLWLIFFRFYTFYVVCMPFFFSLFISVFRYFLFKLITEIVGDFLCRTHVIWLYTLFFKMAWKRSALIFQLLLAPCYLPFSSI